MFKRFGLMIAVNLLIVTAISILTSVLGLNSYLTASGLNIASLAGFCLAWGLGGAFISLLISKMMAKWMMGVQIVTEDGPHRHLVNTVHRLARKAGITSMPEVGIYQSDDINAFATGPSRNNSLVAVSTGLLSRMSDEEVEGVLAHEVAHINNGDMVTMTLVQGVVNAFVMFLSRLVAFLIDQAMRGNDDEKQGEGLGTIARIFLVMALDMLFGLLAAPIVAWFSRYREYRADAGGADLAGTTKMIAALQSLQRAYPQLAESRENVEPAFRSMQISSKKGIMALLSTHPDLEDRISALRNRLNA